MLTKKLKFTLFFLFLFQIIATSIYSQEAPKVKLDVEKVVDNLYTISGHGGNTGVFVGKDGLLIIDTKDGSVNNEIKTQLSEISNKPVRYVINTHWHYDHIGGNESMGNAGAIIVAHENVYKLMNKEQYLEFFDRKVPSAPKSALPIITFTKDLTFHIDDEEIYVFHLTPGHTDGDAVIYFRKSNVIHMGDLYFNGFYPYIGISSGGSINYMINVIEQILPMINNKTRVIPGHGPLSNKDNLEEYLDMLNQIRNKIVQQIKSGKTLEEIIESKPTQRFDEEWGDGFLTPNKFVELVYKDLVRNQY